MNSRIGAGNKRKKDNKKKATRIILEKPKREVIKRDYCGESLEAKCRKKSAACFQ
jgi:hypothetical protein